MSLSSVRAQPQPSPLSPAGETSSRTAGEIERWLASYLIKNVGLDAASLDRGESFASLGLDSLETEMLLGRLYRKHGGELTRVSVETSAPVGAFTGWTPARTVTQWALTR